MENGNDNLRKVRSRAFWDGFFTVFTLGFGTLGAQEQPRFPPVLSPEEARAADTASLAGDWRAVGGYISAAMSREAAGHA